jgi:rhodanese-related sulfurtransferase/SAM-dependent methyltransferase
MARTTIDQLLACARRSLTRLDPAAALDAMGTGATLIDIRSDSQIAEDGVVPGALVIPRNVLEWRLDPASEHRHAQAPGLDDRVILMCNEGYQSSLAAATLQQLGFARATDLNGGFQAWCAAGLPVDMCGASDRPDPHYRPRLRVTGDAAAHWGSIYTRKNPEQVSWYQPVPERSLALIASTRLSRDAAILDVGGGTSSLAALLVASGYTDVTVADISSAALDYAKAQAGSDADDITWIEADIRTTAFARCYDLWHDRALFHFMVTCSDREAYLEVLRRTLRPAGHLILATFGPHAPEQCSGLPVARYDARGVAALLGADFTEIWSGLQTHQTPSGTSQQFLYTHFVHSP